MVLKAAGILGGQGKYINNKNTNRFYIISQNKSKGQYDIIF